MKLLLVNPAYHGMFTLFGLRIPPLGLGYLAAAARRAGHEVRILDLNVESEKDAGPWERYDVAGIGTDTTRWGRAKALARLARDAGLTTVLGGPHPTTAVGQVASCDGVDYVVRGEGEETLVELLACLDRGDDPSTVAGLSYRRRGELFHTPDRPFRQDLDAILPPARDLLPMERYRSSLLGRRPLTPVITSRGCPFRCSFCASSFMNGPRWRAHSAARVVDEMEEVHRRWGYTAIAFSDDNSLMSPARNRAFCREIRRRGLDLHIWSFCRADMGARHPDVIADLASAGLRSVFMGIESPDPRTLESIGKGIRPDDVSRALAVFRRHDVEVLGSYILGHVEDTLGSLRRTLRAAMRYDTNTAQFTILTPYPGTEVFRRLRRRITVRDWAAYDGYHLVFRHRNLSRLQLELGLAFCHLAFYLRSWKSVWGFLRFLWVRRKGLGSLRDTTNAILFSR